MSSRRSSSSRKSVRRNKENGHKHLMQDYFNPSLNFDDKAFTRQYQMPPAIFNPVMNDVVYYDDYFKQEKDAMGCDSFSPHQKLTSAFGMLSYGCSADSLDETYRMGESTVLNAKMWGTHNIRILLVRRWAQHVLILKVEKKGE
ncbi:unnamed protein product [Linum trigynum]|uniref:Uncharacterized protein n=1 Tax=Linum trigynum TaxID=586398 RepID=A0AAV2FNK6_9ROSI